MPPITIDSMRENGLTLAKGGLSASDIVVDLDETLWDWSMTVAGQPLFPYGHLEWLHVRRYLVALLSGVVDASNRAPIRVWTAGYGYRIEAVCQKLPALGAVLGSTDASGNAVDMESASHVCTRLGFLHAVDKAPELIGHSAVLNVSTKLPGAPTAAGRASIDAAKILIDDRRENCDLFTAGYEDRLAIHLVGAERDWRQSVRYVRLFRPADRTYAPAVADALREYLGGRRGIYEATAIQCTHAHDSVRLFFPHHVAYRDWIRPGRALRRHFQKS